MHDCVIERGDDLIDAAFDHLRRDRRLTRISFGHRLRSLE